MSSNLDVPGTTNTADGAATRSVEVRIENVSVAYGTDTPAVREASLAVPAGSTIALLGPSGCGKTSLLRAIAGLERPTTGTIAIGHEILSGPGTWTPPQRRQVGMVFQDGALFPHLNVADNIAFGLRSPGMSMSASDRAARVADLLALVDLTGAGDRLPETLSGGQQQRVALARSLAPRPRVLLLDEPFSALDAALRVQVRSEVGRILREIGVTTVFVTHDQDEAFVLGDRVAVMRGGRIAQVGTPDELYRTPATPWVAGFVGEANFVPGHVGAVDGPCLLHEDEVAHDGDATTRLGPVPLDSSTPVGNDSDVTVLVRPEQVGLRDGNCAEIVDVEYYGHDVRYEIRLDDGSTLAARTIAEPRRFRGDRVCVRYAGTPTEAWPRHH